MSPSFVVIEVRAPDAAGAERLLAEAWEAGIAGCEEREAEGSGTGLLLYVETDRADAVVRALDAVTVDSEIGAPRPVLERDWSEAWRAGLEAVVVSPRLVVRPPFVPLPRVPGRAEVVIDPGQAFGTGGHESTRLALELVDRWLPRLGRAPAVLDVGTGSGVLAIAAAKLGAGRVVGFDTDPVATAAARTAVAANGVAERVGIFTGGIEALGPDGIEALPPDGVEAPGPGRFEAVVANLLRRELEPILADVPALVASGGVVILTGLLEDDRPSVVRALAGHGFDGVDETARQDASGETWIGLVARRAGSG